ncbi:hypothetical protein CF326_g8349 [Tilletia indica]|nr:hypothetical protein CF326_g8349 [Tilletia indica]
MWFHLHLIPLQQGTAIPTVSWPAHDTGYAFLQRISSPGNVPSPPPQSGIKVIFRLGTFKVCEDAAVSHIRIDGVQHPCGVDYPLREGTIIELDRSVDHPYDPAASYRVDLTTSSSATPSFPGPYSFCPAAQAPNYAWSDDIRRGLNDSTRYHSCRSECPPLQPPAFVFGNCEIATGSVIPRRSDAPSPVSTLFSPPPSSTRPSHFASSLPCGIHSSASETAAPGSDAHASHPLVPGCATSRPATATIEFSSALQSTPSSAAAPPAAASPATTVCPAPSTFSSSSFGTSVPTSVLGKHDLPSIITTNEITTPPQTPYGQLIQDLRAQASDRTAELTTSSKTDQSCVPTAASSFDSDNAENAPRSGDHGPALAHRLNRADASRSDQAHSGTGVAGAYLSVQEQSLPSHAFPATDPGDFTSRHHRRQLRHTARAQQARLRVQDKVNQPLLDTAGVAVSRVGSAWMQARRELLVTSIKPMTPLQDFPTSKFSSTAVSAIARTASEHNECATASAPTSSSCNSDVTLIDEPPIPGCYPSKVDRVCVNVPHAVSDELFNVCRQRQNAVESHETGNWKRADPTSCSVLPSRCSNFSQSASSQVLYHIPRQLPHGLLSLYPFPSYALVPSPQQYLLSSSPFPHSLAPPQLLSC